VSAAESQWPAWLRRRTGVEFLGPPNRFFARLTIALSLGAVVYIGAWNAQHYPITLGYDSTAHLEYAHILVHQHRTPTLIESAEAVQPPAYYALAGTAAVLGHKLLGWNESESLSTPDHSYRGAQYLNVLFVLLTAVCVLWLARLVAPDRLWVAAASVGFFAFLPVVAKTEAMFNPENLNMLASAAGVAAATHVLLGRPRRRLAAAVLVLALALGLATRVSTLFTLAAVVVGVIGAALTRRARRNIRWSRVILLAAIVIGLGSAAILVQTVVLHRQPFGTAENKVTQVLHPSTSQGAPYRGPLFHISYTKPFEVPYRYHYRNEAATQTYTEIWGDWFGAFAWSAYSLAPWSGPLTLLKDQSYIGLVPTFLAVVGWLWLFGVAVIRRRELLIVALLPVFAIAGYLYRSYLILTMDGDLFKATYILTTAPVWAVCFGLAVAGVARRSRLLGAGMAVLFALFAVLELRFMLYGIRDHHPIF
jgi:hypothetical protein